MSQQYDHEEEALYQAIAWHQAITHDGANEADGADWDGYLAWLEADPLHRRLYDEIALLDRMVDERATGLRESTRGNGPPLAANGNETMDEGHEGAGYDGGGHEGVGRDDGGRVARPRRWWLAGAVAAVVALLLAVPRVFEPRDVVYATGAGERREVALGDGEIVQLSPASRLIARHGNARTLELARGEAYFSIRHDPSRSLSVRAGGFAVTDIGTRFGVSLSDDAVTVAVAEGHVTMAAARGGARRVSAGEQLVGRGGTLTAARSILTDDVGSWRHGRLVYDQIPLRIVVADLARFSGKRVAVDPAIAERPFSGVLGINDGSRPFQNLAELMAISYRTDADGIRFVGGSAR